MAIAILLSPFVDRPSLAATGGAVMTVTSAEQMLVVLLGEWIALKLVSRWR